MKHKYLVLLVIVVIFQESIPGSEGSNQKYDRKKGWLSDGWKKFKGGVTDTWNKIKDGVTDAFNDAKDWVEGAWEDVKDWGRGVTCALVRLWCKDPPPPPPPPPITCTEMPQEIYYAAKGEDTVLVTWDEPTSTGKGAGKVEKIYGKDPGTYLYADIYQVVYVAKRDGYTSTPCILEFEVKVRTCGRPVAPNHGRIKCNSNPPVYGESCELECFKGYQPRGPKKRTCQENEQFDGEDFYCDAISCDEPTQPENSAVVCTDPNYEYTSLCFFNCDEGFGRSDAYSMTACSSTGTWYPENASDCEDTVAPEIDGCPSPFIAYVGPDGIHAMIDYTMPTATDNSDGVVDVTLEKGFLPGEQVAIDRENPVMNLHIVRLNAEDSAENKAIPCQFTIVIADLMCEPLENKPLLSTDCTEPLYSVGSSCSFSCLSGYSLDGADKAVCRKHEDRDEAYWDWSDDIMPECSNKQCPDLAPPRNGSMGCVSILGFYKECVMACDQNYDIPPTVQIEGIFFCDPALGWRGNGKVYDCTEIVRGSSYKLGAEFYYSGDCNSPDVQEKIKEHVINTILTTRYQSLCKQDVECTVANVVVSCGTGRKKTANTLVVSLDFVVNYVFDPNIPIYDQHKVLENGVYDRYDLFESDMEDGLLDIDGAVADPASLAPGTDTVECLPGLKPKISSLSCSPCPIGTKYDETQDVCVDCPIGTFQDEEGQFSCQSCPSGFSTLFNASKELKDCKELCPPGTASSSGIVPCYHCNVGTYQERIGQTSCTPCPSGSNSTIQGSSSLLDCKSQNVVCLNNTKCGEHGICLPDYDSEDDYQCICRDGYTADDCSIPPSPCYFHTCRNNAECVPHENNYTCNCKPDYTGKYCQHEIVDGGWSPFESWSRCTKTCGTGTQIRYRDCSLPYPQYGGLDCVGDDFEIRECNTDPCPACPYAQRPYKGSVNVTDEGDVLVAKIYCPAGFVLSDPTDTYICGKNTSHAWHPVKSSKEFPKCTAFRPASTVLAKTETIYRNIPDNRPQTLDKLIKVTSDVLDTSPCVEARYCTRTVKTEVFSPVRERRDSGYTIVVISVVDSVIDHDDYFVDGEFQEEAVLSALPQYLMTMIEIERLVDELENYTKDGSLGIEIDGQVYFPDPESFSAGGTLGCPDGSTSQSGLCVNCPPGTKGVNGMCVECEVGTYQDEEAQLECIPCPDGLTTEYGGCVNSDLCLTPAYESPTTNKVNDGMETSTDPVLNKKSNKLVYLAALAVMPLIIIGIIIYCCCNKMKKVNPVKDTPEDGMKEPRMKSPNENHYYSDMKDINSMSGSVIMSAPPNAYLFRPATATDIMLE